MFIFIVICIYIFIYQFKLVKFLEINVVKSQIIILKRVHQIKLIKIHLSLNYFYSNFSFLSNP
jgi:hypothetical protein